MNTTRGALFGNLLESSQPPGMTPRTVSPGSWRRSHHLWHGGSHTGIFPICIWTRLPYQIFPADPLRSQVSWMLGYGIEGDLCRFKTPHPFCTPGRAIMSIPPPCARKTPSQSRMQLPICLYFCFNYLLFHWILWNKFMYLVLAT